MAVKYTIYDPSVVTPNLLEETNLGPLDFRIIEYIERVGLTEITDRDNDGYLEIDLESLEMAMQALGMDEVPVPMAPYFSDTRRFTGRLNRLPDRLASATGRFDLIASREYFTNRFRGEANPLGSVANLLAKHLSAWAVHGGVSIAVPLENESGFSVYGDGRLRFDCDLFAQLGHSDLKGIPGLQFRYIVMSKNNTDNCSPLAATMERWNTIALNNQ